MRRLRLFLAAAACSLAACGLVSLRQLSVQSYPAQKDGIVATSDPVWLEFSAAVDRSAAETLLRVEDPQGSVAGDRRWSQNRLVFTPLSPWVPGTRYVLLFSGSIDTEEGLTYTLNLIVPFYGGSRDRPPRLLSFSPPTEGIAGAGDPLSFAFSEPMDVALFDEHFRLAPSAEHSSSWNAEQTVCTVTPKTRWEGLTRYSWSLPAEARSLLSVPLAEEYRGYFRVLQDTTAPALQSFQGAAWDDISGGYVLYDPATLDNDMALWFEFSEEMDWDTWAQAFSIRPAVQALTTFVSPRVVTVDPVDLWVPEQPYSVSLSIELKDRGGNRPAAEITRSFTPDVPAQRLVRVENTPSTPTPAYLPADWAAGGPLPIEISPVQEHTFTLQFSEPYQVSEVERLLQAIVLEAVYPPSLSDPTLEWISFQALDPRRLLLTYGGFRDPPSAQVRHFYRLSIPADKTATANSRGSYFTEAVTIRFEVVGP
jgi:hypothetical protein